MQNEILDEYRIEFFSVRPFAGELFSGSVSNHESSLFGVEVVNELSKLPEERMLCLLPSPGVEFLQTSSVLELEPVSNLMDRRCNGKFLSCELTAFFRRTNCDTFAILLDEDYFGVFFP